jgi:hypothetical protein
MRIVTHFRRQLPRTAAALTALAFAAPVDAQYAPYAPPSQPQYAQRGAYQGYLPAMGDYAPAPSSVAQGRPVQNYAAWPYQASNYGAPYTTPHTAMAYQAGVPAPEAENLPLTPPVGNVPAGNAPNGAGAYPPPASSAPAGGAPAYAPPGAYDPNYGQAGMGYESYPPAGGNAGYGAGYGYGCDPSAYGACNPYSTYGGMSGALGKHACGCGYWFGGVYGLLMDRDNSNKYPLTFTGPDVPPVGYYPPSGSIVLRTTDADTEVQPGVEFRLGRTFGCGPVDPCGCSCACGPRWGLEGVYWTIFDDDDDAQYVDQATIRTYSMMPMTGLEYDSGAGYRPVNEYWDYGPPAQVQDLRVTLARVHSSFEVQNVEINLLRLNLCGGGYGPAVCTTSYGLDACGGGNTGYGACDGGYAACPPAPCSAGSKYSCTGVCGVRWMQFDEDFMYGVDFLNTTTLATGFLNYWSTVENNLIGAQIGCNGMYRVGCKWGLHLDSLVGLYGNDVDVRQYMTSPTGNVRFIGSQENFDVRSYKTDVAMIGELRLGVSCQISCKCRLYGGWRAIGVTGIALATDQAPNQFLDVAQLQNYVNSNGSLILHGLQAGVEWNY